MSSYIIASVLALYAARDDAGPKQSAGVVEARFFPGSLADGLETYYVVLKVKPGWWLYGRPSPDRGKADAPALEVMGILADGKRAGTCGIEYPPGKARRDAAGKEHRALEGEFAFQCWVVHDDVKDARAVSVRVRVVATDGKTRLAESVVTATYR